MKLTQRFLEKADFATEGQILLRDDETTGFGVRITKTKKTFIFEKRMDGKNRRISLGEFSEALKVEDARKKAVEHLDTLNKGENPADKIISRKKEPTFSEFFELYLERYAKPFKKTWILDQRAKNLYCGDIAGIKLTNITRERMAVLHQHVGKNNGVYVANRLVALLRKVFNVARDWGYLRETAINPATRIRFFKEVKRDRFLTPDELKRFFKALAKEKSPYWRAFFSLSLLLGSRRSELLGARWLDFDFKERLWRIPDTKQGKPHIIPLPGAAVDILKTIPRLKNSPFVFPGTGESGHLKEPKKVWADLIERAKLTDIRPHDLRRTLGSWLAAEGASLILIGKTLGHSQASTTAVYARLNHDPVREALEANSRKMIEIANAEETEEETENA
ncbi:MAG TPA: tyrosine-type recombinase/integrase [Nitrospiria bacterium]|nr:tyrosine-type recombinase/integrase [Nitrospiria bacterium]